MPPEYVLTGRLAAWSAGSHSRLPARPSARTSLLRQVGTLPKGHDVKLLEDHLLGLGMTTRVDDGPDG